MVERLSAIDLFAGAGGATAGLKAAGFVVAAAVENDRSACESYRLNHPTSRLIERDVQQVSPERLLRLTGVRREELTLLQACPPCQTWSSLGSARADDPRNKLITVVSTFVRELRPRAFVIENVPGLRFDPRLDSLLMLAREEGYEVATYLVDAQSVGVPQRRRRLLVLGLRSPSTAVLPLDLFQLLPSNFDRKARTVRQAIGHLGAPPADTDPLHRGRKLTAVVAKRVSAVPPDGRRTDLPEHLQLPCHRRLGRRAATGAYGRISADDVAPTLTTRCTTPACGSFIHPWENRGLTLREAALLQTFPENYGFCGSYGAIERQIGNAIPVRLAEATARVVRVLLAKAQR